MFFFFGPTFLRSDLPVEIWQEFLRKCPAPEGEAQESSLAKGILPATSYLTLPSKLPELKHKEGGYQVILLQLSGYKEKDILHLLCCIGVELILGT